MDLTASEIPVIPVETLEFSGNIDAFLPDARKVHPWLARFSQGWLVHGYDAVADLLADDANLVPGFGGVIDFYGVRGTMWGRFMEQMLLSLSGPDHTRLRGSVAAAFTPRRANREREMMQRVIGELIDEWAPRGHFDFAEFASFFPVTVICGVLGVSAEPIPRIRGALENQLKSLNMDQAAKPLFMAGWGVLWDFAETVIAEREASGQFDEDALLDTLIAAKNAGQMDDIELRFMLLTIVIAGYDTSKNMLTLMMNMLLDRPDDYARCAEDLAFCGKFTQEALRHSAIASPFRAAARDFSYGGHDFRQGELVVLAPSLGGRDPSVFPDPLSIDPERANAGRHLGFGRGAHICLGQFIARNQLQEGIHLIAQRLKNPRRDGEVAWRPFLGAWGLATLPIAFDPA